MRRRGDGHAERTVDLLGDPADFVLKRELVLVEHVEVRLALVEYSEHFVCKRLAALAAFGEYLAERHAHTALCAVLADERDLFLGVGRERVDRHDHRHAELLHVVQMRVQIADAALERGQVRGVQVGLGNAAVVLERAHGRHNHDAVGRKSGLAALDIHELLRAEVCAEAGLGDGDVRQLQRELGRLHAVAAVRDVGKRAAVHQAGGAFERLHQVGLDRVLHQRGHRAFRMQVTREDWLACVGIGDQNVTEALFQVVQVGG